MQSDTFSDWIVTLPGGTRIVFKRDTGRCNRFPYVDLRDPEIVRLFGEIRRENIDAKSAEILMEHFGMPQEHHSDMSFCNYVGSDSEDDMEGEIFSSWKTENGQFAQNCAQEF